MNNLEKEYMFLWEKIYGKDENDDDDPDYETFEQHIEKAGGLVSAEEKGGALIYTAADGSRYKINLYPRLYDALVADGDIEEVKLTEEQKKNFFTDHSEIERVREYLGKLRAAIASQTPLQ